MVDLQNTNFIAQLVYDSKGILANVIANEKSQDSHYIYTFVDSLLKHRQRKIIEIRFVKNFYNKDPYKFMINTSFGNVIATVDTLGYKEFRTWLYEIEGIVNQALQEKPILV